MKSFIVASLVALTLPVLAACGASPTGVGTSTAADSVSGTCETAADCSGFLPQSVEVCADGSESPASWSCTAGACAITHCGDVPGVSDADGGSDGGTDAGFASDNAKNKSCSQASDCAAGDYCSLEASDNQCAAKGVCTPKEAACPYICQPVCGCDGVTYDNYCDANVAGTSSAFQGFCLENPATGCWGSSGGTTCTYATAKTDCNPLSGGAADLNVEPKSGGTGNLFCDNTQHCTVIAPDCADDAKEVIGMDQKTYKNECQAYWKGRVDVYCHPHGGKVCAVDTDVTYATDCAAYAAGVNAVSAGSCN